VELNWASLLRDVPFSQYASNSGAIAAANELDSFGAAYKGPRDSTGKVTPHTLFRGGLTAGATQYFAAEPAGPYLFAVLRTTHALGAQNISQMTTTYAAGIDFNFLEWQNIPNGGIPTGTVTTDPVARFMRDGRALAAYRHVDQLYQAYLVA
jgi:hypothetical protein